jgi:hypothetical protein
MIVARAILAAVVVAFVISCRQQVRVGPEIRELTVVLLPDAAAQCRIRTNPPRIPVSKRNRDAVRWRIVDACKGIESFKEVTIRFDKGQPNPFTAVCALAGTQEIGPCTLDPSAQRGAHAYSVNLGPVKEDPELEIVF